MAGLAVALLAYYFWPHGAKAPGEATNAAALAPASASASGSAASAAAGAAATQGSSGWMPPGAVSNVGGIPLDANGNRVLSSAGLPLSNEPLPVAKPIPIRAPAGAIIGYTKDAQGNSHPIRAGDLKQVPNSPGSFVVVDMWADNGPAVVPATQGTRLSPQELAKLRAQEAAIQNRSEQRP